MNEIFYFFRTTAQKSNFVVFDRTHLILLSASLLICTAIIFMQNGNRKLEITVGITLLTQQIILYLWYFIGGYKVITDGLPLYHCRIAIITLSIGLLFKKDFLMKMGACWGIFGSSMALIFADLDPFIFPHVTQFSYFIGHMFLLFGSVYVLFVKNIKLSKAELKKILIITNAYHIIMFVFDSILKANYGYMRISPISIGNHLNHYVYGLIVIMLFNFVICMEYLLINIKPKDKLSILE